jgi:hypothetical protein
MVSSFEDDSGYSSSFSVSDRDAADGGIKISRKKIDHQPHDDRDITEDEMTDRVLSSRSVRDDKLQNRLGKLNILES